VHVQERRIKLNRASAELQAKLGREATSEELAQATRLKLEHVEEALEAVDSVSLNQGLGSDGDSELGDLFADETSVDPAEEAVESVRRQRVQRAVADLPERQRRIVELRFGFDSEPASLETIGKELGLTRERVRQLESDALARLQLALGDELVYAAYAERQPNDGRAGRVPALRVSESIAASASRSAHLRSLWRRSCSSPGAGPCTASRSSRSRSSTTPAARSS
jgi:RNA polymerase sigma factor (sigma-70 family)